MFYMNICVAYCMHALYEYCMCYQSLLSFSLESKRFGNRNHGNHRNGHQRTRPPCNVLCGRMVYTGKELTDRQQWC